MVRIGYDERPLTPDRGEFVADFRKRAKSEHDAPRQRRVLKGSQVVLGEAHAPTFGARANSSIIDSRIANF